MSATSSNTPGMQVMRDRIAARWRLLAPRERIALQLLLVFAAALAFWFAAWLPTRAALQQARRHVAAEQQLQAHLRANAPRLIAAAARTGTASAEQLPALLMVTADKHGLAISGIQQQADQRTKLALSGAPADVVVWLQTLQSIGVSVDELTLAQQPDASWSGEVLLLVSRS